MMLSYSAEQTKRYAADFARTLRGGEMIGLEGDLGSGKTTFVQGLAQTFGVTDPVRSPTFSLMNIYSIDPCLNFSFKNLIHVDAYRLSDQTDMYSIGLDEWVGRKDAVVFIEWPQRFKKGMIPFSRHLTFTYESEEIRKIEDLLPSSGA